MRRYPFAIQLAVFLLLAIMFIFVLIQTREFLYPIMFGILVSFLLYPIASRFEKWGVPRILSIFISIIVGIGVVYGLIYFISQQMMLFLDDIPKLKEQANNNIGAMQQSISEKFGVAQWKQDKWLRESIAGIFERGSEFIGTVFEATAGTVVKFLLIPVYAFFILYYRNKFERFFIKLLKPFHNRFKPQQLISEVSTIIKNYMIGVSTVVLILCFLNSIGLIIVGVNYAIMLGIISALFNFIPYFGTLIGGAIPLLVALLTEPSPSAAVGVLILFLIIQFTENNILTPNISGGYVRINPFMTILSIIVGGMIWGLPGMVLVVPFMGIVRVFCTYFPQLEPIAYLLSTKGTAKHALTWPKIKEFFNKITNNKPKEKKES